MLTIKLYSRPSCQLCEQAKLDLAAIYPQIPHEIIEINIDEDPALQKKYFAEVPVVEVGSYLLRAPFTKTDLFVAIKAVEDGNLHKASISTNHPYKMGFGDKFALWIANHWLAGVILMFSLYLGLPFLAPVLLKVGATTPANVIYTVYSPLCHQLGFRSFFLFGEQPFYPREAAGIPGVINFQKATGIDENNLLAARQFTGNEKLGYKVALCERDVAIYGGIIIFALVFGLFQKKLGSLHWILWLAIAIFPICLDGFSQLFSQLPIPLLSQILPFRESTPLLRVVTGFLFGFGTAWFGLPYVEESMKESLELSSNNKKGNAA